MFSTVISITRCVVRNVQCRLTSFVAKTCSAVQSCNLTVFEFLSRAVHPCKIFSGRSIVHATRESDFPTRFYLSTCRAYRKEHFRVRGHFFFFSDTGADQDVLQQSCTVPVEGVNHGFSRARNCSKCKQPGYTRRTCQAIYKP